MLRCTIFVAILSSMAPEASLQSGSSVCDAFTLSCILEEGLDTCNNGDTMNGRCTGRHSCENLGVYNKWYESEHRRIHSEGTYTYCCKKFGVCVYSTESDKIWHEQDPEYYDCRTKEEPVAWWQKLYCCKRGFLCDAEVEPTWEKEGEIYTTITACHNWEEGTCIPNEVSLRSCCDVHGKCKITEYCSSDFWDVWDNSEYDLKFCFYPEPVTCLHPMQFGLCCDFFNMCSMPICDAAFDNVTGTG